LGSGFGTKKDTLFMCHLWSDVSGLLFCGNLFEPGDANDVAAEAGLPFVNDVRIKALNG
jgi:hypothetical protein